jgi:hypothetical protein
MPVYRAVDDSSRLKLRAGVDGVGELPAAESALDVPFRRVVRARFQVPKALSAAPTAVFDQAAVTWAIFVGDDFASADRALIS